MRTFSGLKPSSVSWRRRTLFDHQPAGSEQHERKGHLADDQKVSRAEHAVAMRRRAGGSGLHGFRQLTPRRAPGGAETEQHRGDHGGKRRERERPSIEPQHPEADTREIAEMAWRGSTI